MVLKEYQTNPGTYYFINDHLGTPQQLVTSTGAIVWQAAYLPFGQAQIKTATVANNLRFPGQYFDAETGLHYNWNRYYDPEVGRYITADPIGLDGGMNLYNYVGGNPLNAVDFMGLAGSPGIGDQINPFGIRGDGSRDYTSYFDNRFPNTIAGSKALFMQRITMKICANKGASSLSGLNGRADDIDISADMNRFGDQPQNLYESLVKIGNFQFKTDTINIKWDESGCKNCFSYSTTMYVLENTGDNRLGGTFRERSVRMGDWPISGSGCCAQ